MPDKNFTLENLKEKIDEGFKKAEKHTDKKIDEKIDELALVVNKGFEGVEKRFERVENRLDNLEKGQEDIKLRLTNVADRGAVTLSRRRRVYGILQPSASGEPLQNLRTCASFVMF